MGLENITETIALRIFRTKDWFLSLGLILKDIR